MSRITCSKKLFSEKSERAEDIDADSYKTKMADKKEPTIQDLLAEFKKNQEGNNKILTQLNGLQTSVDSNTSSIQCHLKKYDEEMKEVNTNLDKLRATVTTLTERMDTVTIEANELKEDNRKLRKRLNEVENVSQKFVRQEDEGRRRNIVVDGIKEASFQKTRETVTELLSDLGVEMSPYTVVNMHRLSKQSPTSPHQRPVKVIFLSNLTKQTMFKNIASLKDKEKWNRISINDDVSDSIRNKQRDLRCLAASARAKGLKAQQKGNALILEGKRYAYSEINDLPHEISLENAKIVQTVDGVAFQGEHSYLSNLLLSPFVYDGAGYQCAEQFIQIGRAKIAGDQRREEKVRDSSSPYDMIRIGKEIKLTDDSDTLVYKIVVTAAVLKFQQNPVLLGKLKNVKGHLYEATKTKRWGCGFTIAQHKSIKYGENPGDNLFGLILENIHDTALAGRDIDTCIGLLTQDPQGTESQP